MSEKKKKIAIIGGGIAGLSAMWRLNEKYDVTLLEKEKEIGGHAQSIAVETPKGIIYADLAVQLFAEPLYPNLFAYFEQFSVENFLSPLTFSAYFPALGGSWSNTGLHQTSLGRELLPECDRFQLRMQQLPNSSQEATRSMTLGEYLIAENYSTRFINRALKPMFSILAGTRASFMEYSLLYCMVLFNTGLLSFFSPPQWRRLKGGVQSYIQILKDECLKKGFISTSTRVRSLKRLPMGVVLTRGNGMIEVFDEVVIATSAEVALELISDPSFEEEKILSHFEYHPISSVLHTDINFFASLNVPKMDFSHYPTSIYTFSEESDSSEVMGTTTFNVNAYTHMEGIPFPILVSFDPKEEIDTKTILAEKKMKLPKLRPKDMGVKKEMGSIQGVNRVWFCGLDSSTTGHESSFVSGLVIGEALGCAYPFHTVPLAKKFYENLKKVMGIDVEKVFL